MKLKIYCDGGSRGNPGPAAAAFVVYNEQGEVLYKEGKLLGITTNNCAEYLAVIQALKYLSSLSSLSSLSFYLDSLLVVSQLNGLWKVKDPDIRVLIVKVRELESITNKTIVYSHIPRSQNKAADLLVNQTLDNGV